MRFTLHINDVSNPEAKAFLEYARTLKFVQVDEEQAVLSNEQLEAIDEARESLKKNGGTTHADVLSQMKNKYPNAFKS